MFRRHVVFAVFRRNVAGYFSGVLGYLFIIAFVVAGAFLAFQPQFFTNNVANLDQLSAYFPMLLLFLIPAITMSAWADERKLGTDELLFTLPATDFEILMGKYLAVLAVYTIALLFSTTHLVALAMIGNPDPGVSALTYFGYWLAGAVLLSAGMFGSVLTSSTTVAFVIGVVISAIPVFIGFLLVATVGALPAGLRQWFPGDEVLRSLSLRDQLHDFELGIIPLGGVIYFVSLTAIMLYLNLVMIRRRHWASNQQTSMGTQYAVRAICLGIALISLGYLISFTTVRADLTDEHIYSLSQTTRDVLKKIDRDHPVKIQAFLSTDVPREYAPVRKRLIGLLRQYSQIAGSAMEVRYVDVEPFSKEADEAKLLGVNPERIRSEREGRRYEETIYLGAVIGSSHDQVVIPFFGAASPIEYELTRSVRTVANQKRLTVGIMRTDADVIGGSRDWQIVAELKQQYIVKEVSPDSPIDEGKYDVLMVVMPSSLTEPQMKHLVDYVKKGHATLLFDDPFPWAFNTGMGITQAPRLSKPAPGSQFGGMMGQRQPAPPKADDGKATSLLNVLHIAWDNGRVLWDSFNPHPEFASVLQEFLFISPKSGTRSAFSPKSDITSGLQEMLSVFAGSIRPTQGADIDFEPLLRTSPRSGTMEWDEFTEQSFDIFRMSPAVRLKEDRPHYLDPSPHAIAAHITSKGAEKLNVVFVADVDLISDWFFLDRTRGETNLNFDNVTFVLNAVDVLAGEKTFLDLRKRRAELRTLTAVEARTANFVKGRSEEIKKADDEAKELLQTAQHQFDQKRQQIEKDPNMAPNVKEELILRLKEGDERRLQVSKAEVDRKKQQKIDDIKNRSERQIREKEQQIRFMAVAFPPIPAILLGIFVFFRRLSGERRYIVPERRAEKR